MYSKHQKVGMMNKWLKLGMYLFFSVSVQASNPFSRAWNQAVRQSLFEQEVEDVNVLHKIDNHLARRYKHNASLA
jgi:hypothetical protein